MICNPFLYTKTSKGELTYAQKGLNFYKENRNLRNGIRQILT